VDVIGTPYAWVLATLLRGRSKRELILDMIVRCPRPTVAEKLVQALEVYPLSYLLLAREHPTYIWVLDRDEKISSAEILTTEMKRRRWHTANLAVDDCEGLTDASDSYVAMVTSWRSTLVIRHEFAHVVTTFITPLERSMLQQLYLRAMTHGQFVEPLARESIGEYLACGLTYTFFPDLADELVESDPGLHRFLTRMRSRAEDLSRWIVEQDRTRGPGGKEEQERSCSC
jgi:hypothetical protein